MVHSSVGVCLLFSVHDPRFGDCLPQVTEKTHGSPVAIPDTIRMTVVRAFECDGNDVIFGGRCGEGQFGLLPVIGQSRSASIRAARDAPLAATGWGTRGLLSSSSIALAMRSAELSEKIIFRPAL